MARRSSSDAPSRLQRITIVMFGVYFTAVGLNGVVTGQVWYRNYVGGSVLATVAIIIGVTPIVAGLFMPN